MSSLQNVRLNDVEASQMTDGELQAAIAKELFGYDDLHVNARGDLSAPTATGFLIDGPARLPNWPRFQHAARKLEEEIRQRGLWDSYFSELQRLVGKPDVSTASARQRAEAALEIVRAQASAHR